MSNSTTIKDTITLPQEPVRRHTQEFGGLGGKLFNPPAPEKSHVATSDHVSSVSENGRKPSLVRDILEYDERSGFFGWLKSLIPDWLNPSTYEVFQQEVDALERQAALPAKESPPRDLVPPLIVPDASSHKNNGKTIGWFLEDRPRTVINFPDSSALALGNAGVKQLLAQSNGSMVLDARYHYVEEDRGTPAALLALPAPLEPYDFQSEHGESLKRTAYAIEQLPPQGQDGELQPRLANDIHPFKVARMHPDVLNPGVDISENYSGNNYQSPQKLEKLKGYAKSAFVGMVGGLATVPALTTAFKVSANYMGYSGVAATAGGVSALWYEAYKDYKDLQEKGLTNKEARKALAKSLAEWKNAKRYILKGGVGACAAFAAASGIDVALDSKLAAPIKNYASGLLGSFKESFSPWSENIKEKATKWKMSGFSFGTVSTPKPTVAEQQFPMHDHQVLDKPSSLGADFSSTVAENSVVVEQQLLPSEPALQELRSYVAGLENLDKELVEKVVAGDTQAMGDVGLGLLETDSEVAIKLVDMAAVHDEDIRIQQAYLQYTGMHGYPVDQEAALKTIRETGRIWNGEGTQELLKEIIPPLEVSEIENIQTASIAPPAVESIVSAVENIKPELPFCDDASGAPLQSGDMCKIFMKGHEIELPVASLTGLSREQLAEKYIPQIYLQTVATEDALSAQATLTR